MRKIIIEKPQYSQKYENTLGFKEFGEDYTNSDLVANASDEFN